jgi:hypothetical protein
MKIKERSLNSRFFICATIYDAFYYTSGKKMKKGCTVAQKVSFFNKHRIYTKNFCCTLVERELNDVARLLHSCTGSCTGNRKIGAEIIRLMEKRATVQLVQQNYMNYRK